MHLSFREWEDDARSRRAAAALGSDEVQVWIAATPPGAAELSEFASLLSPDERRRAERFVVAEPRRQFVFCRALLRRLAGACLNIEPSELMFRYQPRGKPLLDRPSSSVDLRFNLSHSGRLVAVALALGREVGVDLESARRLDDWESLAARFFSTREQLELRALPAPLRREAFFNGWTRKEAYLKATGEGLTDALAAIEVALAPGQAARLLAVHGDSDAARRWSLCDIPLPPGIAGAVAFENRPPFT